MKEKTLSGAINFQSTHVCHSKSATFNRNDFDSTEKVFSPYIIKSLTLVPLDRLCQRNSVFIAVVEHQDSFISRH